MAVSARLGGEMARRLPKPLASNYEWQEQGKCREVDPEIFFLPYNARMGEKRKLIAEAKKVCATCPVIEQCLNHALTVGEEFGVWGGMSEEERRRINLRKRVVVVNPK